MLSQSLVAIKDISHEEDGDICPSALREVTMLHDLKSPYIIELFEAHFEPNCLRLVFPFYEQDLHAYLKSKKGNPLALSAVKSFTKQILSGLDYCHTRAVLHRDLKPQNILVDGEGNLKLADFGMARQLAVPERAYTHEVCTLWYRAPEILLGAKKYATGIDLWSVGCIIAELSNLEPLFPGESEIDQLFKIFRVWGTPSELNWHGVSKLPDYKGDAFPKWPLMPLHKVLPHLDDSGRHLVCELMRYKPETRLSARRALRHPFSAHAVKDEIFLVRTPT